MLRRTRVIHLTRQANTLWICFIELLFLLRQTTNTPSK
jgi:hypothetical protein